MSISIHNDFLQNLLSIQSLVFKVFKVVQLTISIFSCFFFKFTELIFNIIL